MKAINKNRRYREKLRRRSFFTLSTTKKIHYFSVNVIILIVEFVFKLTLLSKIAHKKAHELILTEKIFKIKDLPADINGLKILFLTDLHIDMVFEMKEKIFQTIASNDYDLCVFGGDYAFQYKNRNLELIKQFYIELTDMIKVKGKKMFGVLGNHDYYGFGKFLETLDVKMLANEKVKFRYSKTDIVVAGIDDSSYFGAHDYEECEKDFDDAGLFRILIAHSPCTYKLSEKYGYRLTLCGHTHGGQICFSDKILPLTKGMVMKNTAAPFKYARREWQYKELHGYTGNGIGCSGFAARLFCPPEIVILTLLKSGDS